MALSIQAQALKDQIRVLDCRLVDWHRSDKTCKRLDAIPGVGPALATALVASVADPKAFRSGRDFAAWVGLVPKQNSRRAGTAWQYHEGGRPISATSGHVAPHE